MTADRRPLGPPAFSEPPVDVPAQEQGHRPLPIERTVFVQAEPDIPEPAPVRRVSATGGIAFSSPERQG